MGGTREFSATRFLGPISAELLSERSALAVSVVQKVN